MKKEALKRGQEIEQELQRINNNIDSLRNREENPNGSDLSWYGYGISSKATEQIREIAINSLVSKRRSLQREFKKL